MMLNRARTRISAVCGIVGAAVLAVALTGMAPVSGAAADPAPVLQGAKVVKPLLPPPGQRRTFATLNQQMKLHSRKAHGPVANSPQVFVIFWGSQWSSDPAAAAPALQSFYRGLGGSDDTWSNVMSQYCSKPPKTAALPSTACDAKSKFIQHPATTPLRGVWFDNATAAPTNATIIDLVLEVARGAQHFGRTSAKLNRDVQYVIASATGTHPDGFPSFCGYHTAVKVKKLGTLAFTNLPYVPDLDPQACSAIPSSTALDGYLVTASHEYGEVVTDYIPGLGWYGVDLGEGSEIADVCDTTDGHITLNTGTFAVEGLFSNAANACRLG